MLLIPMFKPPHHLIAEETEAHGEEVGAEVSWCLDCCSLLVYTVRGSEPSVHGKRALPG